jgi:hypothetical protein
MAEYKLFEGDIPFVSTAEFHKDRERAPHLEQSGHRERLYLAADLIRKTAEHAHAPCGTAEFFTPTLTFSDLGCGDGGLLSVVEMWFTDAWGYDFQPSNEAGWKERRVNAESINIFTPERYKISEPCDGGCASNWGKPCDCEEVRLGNIVAMTEVLEHLADPRAALRWIRSRPDVQYLVCSSPYTETSESHCEEHAWAWDIAGYYELLRSTGWVPVERHLTGMFQVILAGRDDWKNEIKMMISDREG